MTYNLKKTASTSTDYVVENHKINKQTMISLIGKSYVGYGDELQQNTIDLLCNFHTQSADYSKAIPGQFIYDGTNLKLCTGDKSYINLLLIPCDNGQDKIPTGDVTITGTLGVGQTLTVSNTIQDDDGIQSAITYEWFLNGASVGTGSTYIPSESGSLIVKASYKDGMNNNNYVNSATKNIPSYIKKLIWTITSPFMETNANDGTIMGEFTITANGGTFASSLLGIAYDSILGKSNLIRLSDVIDTTGVTVIISSVDSTVISRTNTEMVVKVIFKTTNPNDFTSGKVLLHQDAVAFSSLSSIDLTFHITANFVTMQKSIGTSTVIDSGASVDLEITGSGELGSTISSKVTQLSDTNGMGKLSYQWQLNEIDIPGFVDKTYSVKNADIGKNIQLKVSYQNNDGDIIVKYSNIITAITGKYVNDIVEFKLMWETLFMRKMLNASRLTASEQLDGVLLFYTDDGKCDKQVLLSDSTCSTNKMVTSFNGTLPGVNPSSGFNVTSNIVVYQVDFSKVANKYTKVVYCVCEVATPGSITVLPTELYPKDAWTSSANLTKDVTVIGTVSPFKSITNKTGIFHLEINTIGTTKYPKTILKTGIELRLKNYPVDTKERLCVFGVFTRLPNNGWSFETQYKLKNQLNNIKPLDYLKPPSNFTDLGL